MNVTLSGAISISFEDEWLFEGQALPLTFVCDLTPEDVTFEAGKAKMQFSVPVELAIDEHEWQRAVGELLARRLTEASQAGA